MSPGLTRALVRARASLLVDPPSRPIGDGIFGSLTTATPHDLVMLGDVAW